uniref:TF-B3 domain-containing protein n=1 Tax=Oryza meridionalis TaxID=40149 RepID=A0A0E0ERC9_9ORYZ
MYMTAGWAQFIEATGLQVQESAVFRVLSTSKMHFIIFAKDGYLRCPVPEKPRDSEPTRQSLRTSSPQGKATTITSPIQCCIKGKLKHDGTSTSASNNRRTISEMCFCTKDIRLSAEVKNYIKDIAPFLQPSGKFYVTAINATFVKQGRVYLAKEFSKKYIAPLARRKDSTNQGTNPWTPLIHHGSPQITGQALQPEIGMNPFCDKQQLPDWNNLHIPLLQDRSPGSNSRCLVKAICIGYNLSSSCYRQVTLPYRQVTLPGLSKYLQPVSMFIISALYSLSIDI